MNRFLNIFAKVTSGWLAMGLGGSLLSVELPVPANLRALPRQLRVDLVWDQEEVDYYEIQRAPNPDGPFARLSDSFHRQTPAYSDFVGQAGKQFAYRVRSVRLGKDNQVQSASPWSEVVTARTTPFAAADLLTEVQEAGVRYFFNYAHPVSGLAREGAPRSRETCAIGATGMGFFNLVVGVERGFIPRTQAVRQALKTLRFLARRAQRFHGVYPHWMHGTTGRVIPFSKYDNGADLVETAYLAEGLLLLREYFTGRNGAETEMRTLADQLWREIEWDWFAREDARGAFLYWHWSPQFQWRMNLPVRGFNECHIVYLLALASPSHSVPLKFYRQGWEGKRFARPRSQFGVQLELGRGIGFPLFFTHYSYLGFDPRAVRFHGRTYFEHFQDACRVQVLYAQSKQHEFKGYGPLWGLTSSLDPDGYQAHAPGLRDNGTISPTAALSSMPYVPEASKNFMVEAYRRHGQRLWGEFGFYDAFNFSRNWVARKFLGIDVGPIAPMIENQRTGLCWQTFMQAPEIQATVRRLKLASR